MVNYHRGFTLVELIVAIVIGAMVATAITSSLSQLGRAREVARLRMERDIAKKAAAYFARELP